MYLDLHLLIWDLKNHFTGVENYMINVLFVCWGNICRSPMCEFVFKNMVKGNPETTIKPPTIHQIQNSSEIYDLRGRSFGADVGKLGKGIYIQSGKKIVRR